jgi:uncharacterized damage-inducible protein DinB
MKLINKPHTDEYPEYASMYINLLPDDGLILDHLKENFISTKKFIYSLPNEKLLHRYTAGKWTIKEILVHIIDDERIYAYRALRFARNDNTKLPGFEQDNFTLHSYANVRDIDNIFAEYQAVRDATIALFNGLDDSAFNKDGYADGNKATVRALLYHIAGHELHHINFIKQNYF